eukprot:CAMPEP_0179214178 /NCGR_PEP_ID=MMETSP0797-20121207/2162_1 /TAXON_ID=47934 /ORGANISM="Dinophysis acuminata, Strain DAEP01" /LENGTH=61 /DNA_ID=CAMNT_0020920163 /DNA_START=106 /DNA_END=287 /DNA_ORIENTATION=+
MNVLIITWEGQFAQPVAIPTTRLNASEKCAACSWSGTRSVMTKLMQLMTGGELCPTCLDAT